VKIYYSFGKSKFGKYLVASNEKGITDVLFFHKDVVRELKDHWPKAEIVKKITPLHKKVANLFKNGKDTVPVELKLELKGTPFQISVWNALRKIPRGKLVTYSALAFTIRKPKAHRAVGTAVGINPIGFIVPCHRVIRADGKLGDYRWGIERKKAIINWEKK
jgi:AraC family transcriptional regulator, regulatory protein of adaptative response / methylated-DNA-[protein]-cysteine methyltransferase